jgi:hypothetical protein
LDPDGSPVVLSYDIPEPTSYRGRQVIELGLPREYFITTAQVQAKAKLLARGNTTAPTAGVGVSIGLPPAPIAASNQVYVDDVPLYSDALPPDRAPLADLSDMQIASAFEVAKTTGRFDPAIFPNVSVASDMLTTALVRAAIAGLDTKTVITEMNAGNRLVIFRDPSGRYLYRFIQEPVKGNPTLMLVEYYRLSSFPARYGAGRTIKTFSLLPGERTTIRINTYKRSTQTFSQASSILDSTSEESENDFEQAVMAEQSTQDASSRAFEYNAEAKAEGKASWGWGAASVSVSGGVKGSTNASRDELAKNVSNAVTQNSARASSRRDVQVDTSLDVKLEAGEEQAIERELSNVNMSRTLNFVFRQMNQEFVSLLHLVDVRVAYFNGYTESRMEVPLPQLNQLLDTYIVPEQQAGVLAAITAELKALTDYRDQVRDDFIQTRTLTADGTGVDVDYLRVNPEALSSFRPAPDSPPITVPGVIMAADSHVMRTDGVVVDTFLGLGNGLDDYSTGLQQEAVRTRQIENDTAQAEIDRRQLALQIIRDNNAAAATLYAQLFPISAVINQIDHAAITSAPSTGGQLNGAPPATAARQP